MVGFAELIAGNVRALELQLREGSAAVASETPGHESVAAALTAASTTAASLIEQVGHVLSAGRILSSIVNDVLDLSKINEGKLEV